jgi:hypothetical protein
MTCKQTPRVCSLQQVKILVALFDHELPLAKVLTQILDTVSLIISDSRVEKVRVELPIFLQSQRSHLQHNSEITNQINYGDIK